MRVPGAAELLPASLAICAALHKADPVQTTAACDTLLREVCRRLRVPAPGITVLGQRPANRRRELHGLYDPAHGAAGHITVFMRTARRQQVVAFRTFLRTLVHELCHHLDYRLLGLARSLHTAGFYRRESSLYRQLLPADLPSRAAAGARRASPG